ncbi:claudin-10 [Puntigrus tetrazona]|uniref:claudin-10 n=1 Tax=Puntigrus tetrazona TaxID=1606681 RepID=UPI001C8ADE21|nr:claudin-10 [Puntigrus tetrazona]
MSNMAREIMAFILTTSGWVLVSSTLPTDYWKVSSNDGSVITTSTFWSNLWKTCVTDSTGVSSCKDFPSMLALDGYIQVCRGLMIAGVCLGFFGSIFALIGMKCTKIGGPDQTKARLVCLSGITFICTGLCSLSAYSLYAHRITSEFFDPLFLDQKYELGAALFIGWSGSMLCLLGGALFCLTLSDVLSSNSAYPSNRRAVVNSGASLTSRALPQSQSSHTRRPPPEYSSNSQHFDKNAYV